MTTFYTIESANGRIPELRELLLRLRDDRDDLVRLRDQLVALEAAGEPGDVAAPDEANYRDEATPRDGGASPTEEPAGGDVEPPADGPGEVRERRRITLRMQGVVDRMQASVATIDAWGITLRDIGTGLIDFPALVSGRQVWLCWQLDDDDVDWWHALDDGFAGRRRLADLA